MTLSTPIAAQTDDQTSTTASGTAAVSTMVSGFDRFARYGEISEQLAGSLLISELSCSGCHPSQDNWLQPKRGPRLSGTGNRIQRQWLQDYLADPQKLKPGTTMPHMLSSLPPERRTEAVEAIAAFLGTQQQPFAFLKAGGGSPVVHEFWNRGNPERGMKLYHSIGCVACHEPDADYETVESKPSAIDELLEQLDPEEIVESGLAAAARQVNSVPHGDLAGKYSLRSLTMMLIDPTKIRPSARMPSLRLAPDQAADIATYLLAEKTSSVTDLVPDTPPRQLVDRGRSLFVKLGCSNCHEATGVDQKQTAMPLDELNLNAGSSCIENPSSDMPHYHLDDLQRSAIRSVLKEGKPQQPTAVDEVAFRMLQLNCFGCHERDGNGGVGRYRKAYFETVGHVDLGDEGRLPPALSGVGRKLLPKALASVFQSSTPPHRRYMTIRMPAYPTTAIEPILAHLPEADEVDKSQESDVFSGPQLADAGREMVNTGCVQCHPFRGEALPGVVGIDLNEVTSRVYPRWFYDFVFNPSVLKNRTRMPTFFPNGKSNRQDVLDGNVHDQITAIWAYLKNLEQEQLPEKIEVARSANYELVPQDNPIVLRTFMDAAGTHAFTVGFPQGVHYAFDAEEVRAAIAWKGRFLDARGTWFERFAPPAKPLGERQVSLPAGTLFLDESPRKYEFGGYRLDSAGVPTLLYRYGDWSIEDRIEATDEGHLKRTLNIDANMYSENVFLRAHAGQKLVASGPSAYTDDQGLKVELPEEFATQGSIRRSDNEQNWLIPLRGLEQKTIELEYQW